MRDIGSIERRDRLGNEPGWRSAVVELHPSESQWRRDVLGKDPERARWQSPDFDLDRCGVRGAIFDPNQRRLSNTGAAEREQSMIRRCRCGPHEASAMVGELPVQRLTFEMGTDNNNIDATWFAGSRTVTKASRCHACNVPTRIDMRCAQRQVGCTRLLTANVLLGP